MTGGGEFKEGKRQYGKKSDIGYSRPLRSRGDGGAVARGKNFTTRGVLGWGGKANKNIWILR